MRKILSTATSQTYKNKRMSNQEPNFMKSYPVNKHHQNQYSNYSNNQNQNNIV